MQKLKALEYGATLDPVTLLAPAMLKRAKDGIRYVGPPLSLGNGFGSAVLRACVRVCVVLLRFS